MQPPYKFGALAQRALGPARDQHLAWFGDFAVAPRLVEPFGPEGGRVISVPVDLVLPHNLAEAADGFRRAVQREVRLPEDHEHVRCVSKIIQCAQRCQLGDDLFVFV